LPLLDYPGKAEEEIQQAKPPRGRKKREVIHLNHPLRDVQHLLSVLEAFSFQISIHQALTDDESWQDDVIALRGLGEKYRHIRELTEGH
jgi:hypothetical protein